MRAYNRKKKPKGNTKPKWKNVGSSIDVWILKVFNAKCRWGFCVGRNATMLSRYLDRGQ